MIICREGEERTREYIINELVKCTSDRELYVTKLSNQTRTTNEIDMIMYYVHVLLLLLLCITIYLYEYIEKMRRDENDILCVCREKGAEQHAHIN